jgi:ribosomal protein S27AE
MRMDRGLADDRLHELDSLADECLDCGQSLVSDEQYFGICGNCVYTELDPANDTDLDPDWDRWVNDMLAPLQGGEECFD